MVGRYVLLVALLASGVYLVLVDRLRLFLGPEGLDGLLKVWGVTKWLHDTGLNVVVDMPSVLYMVLMGTVFALFFRVKGRTRYRLFLQDIREQIDILFQFHDQVNDRNLEKVQSAYDLLHKNANRELIRPLFHSHRVHHPSALRQAVVKHFQPLMEAVEQRIEYYAFQSSVFPMLGMIGTLAGLMLMAVNFKTGNSPMAGRGEINFQEVAIALLTTLYASIYTVARLKPLGNLWRARRQNLARLTESAEGALKIAHENADPLLLGLEDAQVRHKAIEQLLGGMETPSEKEAKVHEPADQVEEISQEGEKREVSA